MRHGILGEEPKGKSKVKFNTVSTPVFKKKEPSLEDKILAGERDQALTEEELIAVQAAAVAGGDWGPVFVYGQMLSQQAWCALIDRVPDMRPCWLRGFERREIICSSFAGLVAVDPDDNPDALTIGQAVQGLLPWERRLFDSIVDDAFELVQTVIQPLDDLTEDIDATTYVWRQARFPDAVSEKDWSQEYFNENYEEEFTDLCKDIYENYKCSKMSDEDLKEQALERKRGQTGFDEEEDYKPSDTEEDPEEEEGDAEENDQPKQLMGLSGAR